MYFSIMELPPFVKLRKESDWWEAPSGFLKLFAFEKRGWGTGAESINLLYISS